MNRQKAQLLLFTLILINLSSCVAKKEFDALFNEKTNLETENAELKEKLEIAEEKISRLEVQVEEFKSKSEVLQKDLDFLQEQFNTVQGEYERVNQLYKNLLNNSNELSTDLAQQQQRLLAIQDDLEIERKKNLELAEDLAKREARVAELEKLIADKEQAVQQLKRRVTDALLNFDEGELKVEVKNGKVYVSLAEKLLFGSGSNKVDEQGANALKQLANALKGNSEINIMVEGHTDNVPISRTSQYMNDNWDLSVMRATSIVRILVSNGVNPEAITASGRGEFSPIELNNTPENKALNRRTEIILTPKLDELFQILETY
ncbi:OmpA family protein [Roseivirga sp.]|uniref:OmpA family protein n=1 Tax=Roseivirga sp. TaxID=1964215 RepID=UPI003B51D596